VADPSCPYCSASSGKNPALNNQIGPQFKLVSDGGTYVAPVEEMKKMVDSGQAGYAYIYFPGHRNGDMAMKALYCADEKGKFWQAHDLLMAEAGYNLINNTVLNDKTKSGELAEFLKSAVAVADMKSCLDSGKYDSVLSADTSLAQTLGVQGTPGFFVNTTPFAGAYSWTDMKSAVDAALN
jgi:protein-disulfide isomerase